MAKKENEKSPVLTIEGKQYYQEDLNDEQLLMLAHVQDLDRKINSSKARKSTANQEQKNVILKEEEKN